MRVSKSALMVVVLTAAPAAAAEPGRELRHEIEVRAPVARVWQAWTTNEGVQAFFPGIRPGSTNIRREPGGPFQFEFLPQNPLGARGCDRCVTLAYQVERMLSFTWDHRPDMAVRGHMTHVVLRCEPLGASTIRVTLVQDGWGDGEEWDESYAYFDNAWNGVLARFASHIAAPAVPEPPALNAPYRGK